MKTITVIPVDDRYYKIEGIASTQHRDLDGEIIHQNGLNIEGVFSGKVPINLEHKGRSIGVIEQAKITSSGLWVKGKIFLKYRESKRIFRRLTSQENSQDSIKMSIEMIDVVYSSHDSTEVVSATLVGIALVGFNEDAANPNTYVNLLKSINREKLIAELVRRSNDPKFKERLVAVLSRYT